MKKQEAEASLDAIRHSLAHLLATAVLKKFPKAKLGIGPVIENGFYYDFLLPRSISSDNLKEFEKTMRELIHAGLPITGKKATSVAAKKLFKDQPFKLALIKEFTKEKKGLTTYATGNIFTDLCRGGHVKNTKEIPADAFTLTKIAGAYWKGDEKNPQLQRIYGAAFATKKELDHYLWQQEEARKRDHRVLGERLKLFTFAKEAGPGLPLWLPNGTIIREEIEKEAKRVEHEWGYERVVTPHIAKEDLFKLSGHIPYYAEDMFPPMKLDDGNYYLKAMNCPLTHLIYRSEPRSYRDLPVRYAEYGTVYRHELSGTLAGLLRTRGFTQNDAHIYCREDQVEDEFLKVMQLHEYWYSTIFGIKDFYMRLSLPAKDKKKYAGMPQEWKHAVEIVRRAMQKSGLPFKEVAGEAAFYGPKVDFQIKSVIGREETASTNQLDILAPQRFGLIYHDKDGKEKPVYIIHRAPLGSHERFIAFLIEHYAGDFPLWLAPTQVVVLPVSEKFSRYGEHLYTFLKENTIRTKLDTANESLGKRVRGAELMKIPYMIIVGEEEEKGNTVSVRSRSGKQEKGIRLEAFTTTIQNEIEKKI